MSVKRPTQQLQHADVILLLAEIWSHHPRVALAAQLMTQLGLRLAEARNATWGDIDALSTDRATITVHGTSNHTNRTRTLPLPAQMRVTLLSLQKNQKLDAPCQPPSNWPLILNRWGKTPSKNYCARVIRHASLKACGFQIRTHSLRHYFATRLLKHTNLRVVQMALGHRSITSTQLYTHPTLEDLRTAMNAAAITDLSVTP